MEAYFDNKTNIVNARVCAVLDQAVMYTVETKFEFKGRFRTILRDENPVPGANAVVGAINWRDKSIEVLGHRQKLEEVRRKTGSLFNKQKFWRWAPARKEYELVYTHEEWKATIEDGKTIAGRFCIPFRPHLFHKSERPVVHLTSTALAEDEVFLLLVFLYEEVRRQDKTNTSISGGTGAW
ncbi:hypothetical protein MIND_00260800 [Mycena indigotica]|uniref:Uncharacterized protein n=1 Tax=Mycena indigotica TaxID=2126181 RepID=A0A8H6T8U2_9AGAR|nr:uncharacterized protein MIND_00260800 [Mycena indigotica]KAF7312472.1 hypothetical protein MIND_00260800 [Mycena indigotica]